MKLRGKRVVITGASSGIGRELLKRLCRAGATVMGVARDTQPITNEFPDVYAIDCDVSNPEAVDVMLKEVERVFGEIDVFVANAGFAYYGPIGNADWERTAQIFKVNVISPIYTLQKLTEAKRTRRLNFMVTSSALGKMVLPGFALYSATKFALDGFIRAYRLECPKNVRVIPVYPVANNTPFFRKAGGREAPIPLLARQSAKVTAFCMEMGLRLGMRSVYTSAVFIVRCILSRVTPIDLFVQAVELPRFCRWKKRHSK
ncbi:MAG: SDR family NAD(P)-dependent oxidoreductase [Christensenellales bacterium]|jgi:NAD(P)-dependent dehydrogenase (short-subunit alcohol dehydrogenase family)